MTCEPDHFRDYESRFPLPKIRLEVVIVARKLSFLYSGSSATLNPWRSNESCLSKDQRETPLTCSTEVSQTCEKGRTGSLGESGWRPDPVKKRNLVGETDWKF